MMLRAAKSLLFTFLTLHSAALVVGAAVPGSSSSFSNKEDGTVKVLEENGDRVAVTFKSACNGCLEGENSHVTFRLDIPRAKEVCGEGNILLNDEPLEGQWDGVNGIGEYNITADLGDNSDSTELCLSWRSLCVESPQNSIPQHTAQILALTFVPMENAEDVKTSGFAVSFNPVNQPEIFKLINSPVELPEDQQDSQWLDGSSSTDLHLQQSIEDLVDGDLEADLKELESLKEQAAHLNHRIKEKDYKIRNRLQQDCASVSTRLRHCGDASCFLRTQLKVLPDLFRLIRYRFGPLPSSPSGSPCHLPTKTDPAKPTGGADGFNTTDTINSTAIHPKFPQLTFSNYQPGVQFGIFIRNVACAILLAVGIFFSVRYCRNTITCQRRRADLAARREERRARVAYRRAALKHKWRQWWNGFFRGLLGGRNAGSPQYTHLSQGGNASHMGAEILGLRRVLEYVGELVRYEDEPEPQTRGRPIRRDIHVPQRPSTPTPSSTAPLTTIGSPRASSVMTYSSDSLDTAVGSSDTETVTIVSA